MRQLWAVAVFGSLTVLGGCSKTEFEKTHRSLVKKNPSGIVHTIKPARKSRTLRVSEWLPIDEEFTAKYPHEWQLEVLDGFNAAGVSDLAYVSDGSKTRRQAIAGITFLCCSFKRVWLGPDPVRLPYASSGSPAPKKYRWIVLPHKPGTYYVYVVSHRLLSKDQTDYESDLHGHGAASNLLEVNVVSPDDTWNRVELDKVRAILTSEEPSAETKEQACYRLTYELQSDDAIMEKLRLIGEGQKCASPYGLIEAEHPSFAYEQILKALSSDVPIEHWSGASYTLATLKLRMKDANIHSEDWGLALGPPYSRLMEVSVRDAEFTRLHAEVKKEQDNLRERLRDVCQIRKKEPIEKCLSVLY